MVISFTLDWVLVPLNSNFLEYLNFLKGGVFPPPLVNKGEKNVGTQRVKGVTNKYKSASGILLRKGTITVIGVARSNEPINILGLIDLDTVRKEKYSILFKRV